MSFLLIEIAPHAIKSDSLFAEETHNSQYIYEHLKYIYSKSGFVPAIKARLVNGELHITQRIQYLAIAKELNLPKVRVILDEKIDSKELRIFLDNNQLSLLDWKDLTRKELLPVRVTLFFSRSLDETEKAIFNAHVLTVFFQHLSCDQSDRQVDSTNNLQYTHDNQCVEFSVESCPQTENYAAQTKEALINFHNSYVPILSFQGRKFQ